MTNSANVTAVIRQEPKLARMSGISPSNSKRLLDPPLVIELQFDGEYSNDALEQIGNTFACKLNLFDFDTNQNADHIIELFKMDSIQTASLHNLLGNPVTTAKLLSDSDSTSTKKLFFVFPHLSIRLTGRYYLSCSISRLQRFDQFAGFENVIHLNTEKFEVFTSQLYPGNLGK
jgi:Velvet factor